MNSRDEESQPIHPWKKAMWNAQRNARRELIALNMKNPHPDKVLRVSEQHRYLHEVLIDYADRLRSKRDSLSDLWEEELVSDAPLPKKRNTLNVGQPDVFGEYDGASVYAAIEFKRTSVSLESLLKDWAGDNTAEVVIKANDPTPRVIGRETVQYYVSPRVARRCINQLDDCIEALSWSAEEGISDYEVSKPV